MSLNWDLGNVPNWEEKRQDETNQALLDVCIWGQISVDVGIYDAKDLEESNWRYRYLDRISEYTASTRDGGFNPSREQLQIWQGLATNVTKITRKQWLKRVHDRLAKEVDAAAA